MQRLREEFEAKNIQSISGASELQGLELGDKIGNASSASDYNVFDAYVAWAIQCHGILPDVVLDVEAPGLISLPIISGLSPVRCSFPAYDFLIQGFVLDEPMQVDANALIQKDASRA